MCEAENIISDRQLLFQALLRKRQIVAKYHIHIYWHRVGVMGRASCVRGFCYICEINGEFRPSLVFECIHLYLLIILIHDGDTTNGYLLNDDILGLSRSPSDFTLKCIFVGIVDEHDICVGIWSRSPNSYRLFQPLACLYV